MLNNIFFMRSASEKKIAKIEYPGHFFDRFYEDRKCLNVNILEINLLNFYFIHLAKFEIFMP